MKDKNRKSKGQRTRKTGDPSLLDIGKRDSIRPREQEIHRAVV